MEEEEGKFDKDATRRRQSGKREKVEVKEGTR